MQSVPGYIKRIYGEGRVVLNDVVEVRVNTQDNENTWLTPSVLAQRVHVPRKRGMRLTSIAPFSDAPTVHVTTIRTNNFPAKALVAVDVKR